MCDRVITLPAALADGAERDDMHFVVVDASSAGPSGAKSRQPLAYYSRVSPAGPSEIAGKVNGSCEVLETPAGKSTILCFRPAVAPHLSVALASGTEVSPRNRTHIEAQTAPWKLINTSLHENSFLGENALKPGDDVWVWESTETNQSNAAAMAASLAALEKADLASLRTPEEAPPTKANEVSQASKQKLENAK